MAGSSEIVKILAFVASMAACIPSSAPSQNISSTDNDLQVAMAEMKAGSYYGFAMLLQIVHMNNADRVPLKDVTFLMPSDQDLADVIVLHYMGINFLHEFFSRHAIPQSLRFNNLLHFPTGTLIPTYRPDRMLRVSNRGRSNFFLNNSRIVSPNVCRATASVACHGISAVIEDVNIAQSPPSEPSAPAPSITSVASPPPAPSNSVPVHSPAPAFVPSAEVSNPSPPDSPGERIIAAPSPSPFLNIAPVINGTGSKGAAGDHLQGLRRAYSTSILLIFAVSVAYFLQA